MGFHTNFKSSTINLVVWLFFCLVGWNVGYTSLDCDLSSQLYRHCFGCFDCYTIIVWFHLLWEVDLCLPRHLGIFFTLLMHLLYHLIEGFYHSYQVAAAAFASPAWRSWESSNHRSHRFRTGHLDDNLLASDTLDQEGLRFSDTYSLTEGYPCWCLWRWDWYRHVHVWFLSM